MPKATARKRRVLGKKRDDCEVSAQSSGHFVDKNAQVLFYEEIKRFLIYFFYDLLTNAIIVFLLLALLSQNQFSWPGFIVVLLMLTFFTYFFGGYENFFNPTYGITWETQFVFFWTFLTFFLLGYVGQLSLPSVGFWVCLWVYLNLISPYLSLVVRRAYPFRTVFVNHEFLPQYRRRLEFWGFKITDVVEHDKLIEWLCAKSNYYHFIENYDVILIQARNSDGITRTLAEEFFIRFALLKSLSRFAFITNNHIHPIITHPLVGVNRRLKRMIDFLLVTIVLAIFWPMFLFIAFIVKIDSPGPAIYRQRRPGKGMKYFWAYKFRTMYQDADRRFKEVLNSNSELRKQFQTNVKLKNDPRVTKIGRILRAYSLDEIPQLLNILKGEMTLVGYRPIVYTREIEYYLKHSMIVFHVLPGGTGRWQISGRSDLPFEQKVKMDVDYIHNWSFLEDLRILLKTPKALLSKKGAY